MESNKPEPSQLSPENKAKIKEISDSLRIDRLTVSFSVEERSLNGRKSNAFYSVTASRGTGAEVTRLNELDTEADPVGYTMEEARVARMLLGKHVVAAVYDDAVRRGILPSSLAQEELHTIIARYDAGLVRILNGSPNKEPVK